MKKLKWTTVQEYVDLETGKLITKKQVNENYIIIKKTKKYHVNETKGTAVITNECSRSRQGKLFNN